MKEARLRILEMLENGKITAEEAAQELSKPCVCGIFNPVRAARLLQEFI